MKRTAKIVVLLIGLLGTVFMGYKVLGTTDEKPRDESRFSTMPDFSFTDLNGAEFSKSDIMYYVNTIFVYFNSECDYCQNEAAQLSQNLEKFDTTQFLFVSVEQPDKIKDFAAKYELSDRDNIIFLKDGKDSFSLLFDAASVPFFVAYDAREKLKFSHSGTIGMEDLLQKLEE